MQGVFTKIGVCNNTNLTESSFTGWALLNGELTSNGQKIFGGKIKSGDTVGLMVDLDDGVLSFLKNGQYLG